MTSAKRMEVTLDVNEKKAGFHQTGRHAFRCAQEEGLG